MKKLALVMAALALGGCATIDDYKQVIQTPPPAGLDGYWQSSGPQSKLVSPQAMASLIVTAQGDTLDCRQWQRTIAVPGKLTLLSDEWTNVTNKLEVYELERDGDTLEYDGMTLKRVAKPTPECIVALSKQSFATSDTKAEAERIEQGNDPDAALNAEPLAAANAAVAREVDAAKAAAAAAASAAANAQAPGDTTAPKEGSVVAPTESKTGSQSGTDDATAPVTDADSSSAAAPAPTATPAPATNSHGRFIRVPPAGVLTTPTE